MSSIMGGQGIASPCVIVPLLRVRLELSPSGRRNYQQPWGPTDLATFSIASVISQPLPLPTFQFLSFVSLKVVIKSSQADLLVHNLNENPLWAPSLISLGRWVHFSWCWIFCNLGSGLSLCLMCPWCCRF